MSNPFDAFGDPEEDKSGFQQGAGPSLWESFSTNAAGQFREASEALQALRARRTIDQAQRDGVALPGDSPFAGKPAQPEVDQALADLGAIKKRKEQFDSFESPTIAGKAAGFLGGFGGGMAAPENLISAGGVVGSRVARGAMALGSGSTSARVMGAGVEAGGVNALLDLPIQAAQVGAGLEEHYNPLRTAMAFGLGAGLGSGMQGAVEWLARRAPTSVPRTIEEQLQQPVPPVQAETASVPVAKEASSRSTIPVQVTPAEPADAMPPVVTRPAPPLADPLDMAVRGELTSDRARSMVDEAKAHGKAVEDELLGPLADEWRDLQKKSERAWNSANDKRAKEYDARIGEIEETVDPAQYDRLFQGEDPDRWRDLSRKLSDVEASREDSVAVIAAEVRNLPETMDDAALTTSQRDTLAVLQHAMATEQARGGNPRELLKEAFQERFRRYGEGADAEELVTAQMTQLSRLMGDSDNTSAKSLPAPARADEELAPAAMLPQGRAGDDVIRLDDVTTPQPFAAQPMAGRSGQTPATVNPDSRFPKRRDLAGEATKPRVMPANATEPEVRAFRVTEAIRSLAERMGRKVEVDSRFSIRGALGEYKPKDGVIRLRQEGDLEVFAHEFGHAADQRLRDTGGQEWSALRRKHANELKPLDANQADPAKKTVVEGVAEFMRMYVTNPAYAQKQAPNFHRDFEAMLAARDPELGQMLADAARVSQIDSGMSPAQVFEGMLAPAPRRGLAKYADLYRKNGLGFSLARFADDAQAAVFGESHYVRKFVDNLVESRFTKTGQPLPKIEWDNPYKRYRMLPGAAQNAADALYHGQRSYFDPRGDRVSPPLYAALEKAFLGDIGRVERFDDPLRKAFVAYLTARRGRNLYERWRSGDLENPPVRASINETHAAVADFEARFPHFVGAADEVFAFNRATWTRKFESGLISREIHDQVLAGNGDYVPFFRDMDDQGGTSGAKASQPGQERSVVKRLKGSTRDIIDPLHTMIADVVQTERIIAINDVWRSLYKLAQAGGEWSGRFLERVPNTEMKATSIDLAEAVRNAAKAKGVSKADADTVITSLEQMVGQDMTATVFRSTETTAKGESIAFMWENGERVPLKIGNDEISKAFFDTVSAMSAAERDLLFTTLGKVNSVFAQLITNAPQFALKNIIMDNMSRIFIPRNTGVLGRVPGASVMAGAWAAAFDREFSRNYAAGSGIRGGVASAAAREFAEGDKLRGISMGPRTAGSFLATVSGDPIRAVLAVNPWQAIKLMVKGIEATETLGRLGQAKLVFNHLRKQGVSEPHAFAEATFEARDILDYDQKGWGVTRANRFLVFLNPNLQGIKRANDVLFGDPFRAAVQAHRRGGYASLDGDMKQSLADGVAAWGMIALGATLSVGYYFMQADEPVYQRSSNYMKSRYYIFNSPFGDGERAVTVPKPFDAPGGIFTAIEFALDGMRRQDPKGWERARKGLEEGFVPRHFSSTNQMISANPFFKLGAELATGKKIPFEGDGDSFSIVPRGIEALPPEMQWTATTSWMARQMGQWFGVSPVVADHVMNGFGATTARDANAVLTATMGSNPNTSVKDALLQATVGGLYRKANGAGGSVADDFQRLVGRDTSKYMQAVKGYRHAVEKDGSVDADAIYSKANDTAKALITLHSEQKFKPEHRQLHPLERARAVTDILNAVRRDLGQSQVQVQDRSAKRGQERDFIEVEPQTARAISNTLGRAIFEEYRNGLRAAGEPGYQAFDMIDTKPNFAAIRALSPEVANEIEKRINRAHVLPADVVANAWPVVKERLLRDREAAVLGDVLGSARAARVRERFTP